MGQLYNSHHSNVDSSYRLPMISTDIITLAYEVPALNPTSMSMFCVLNKKWSEKLSQGGPLLSGTRRSEPPLGRNGLGL